MRWQAITIRLPWMLSLLVWTVVSCSAQSRHTDTRINYLGWDGTPKWATLVNGCIRGDTGDCKIRYKTWGGGNWEASLNHYTFTHCENGNSSPATCHKDTQIKYIAGDQRNWQAEILGGTIFQHTPDGWVPPKPAPSGSGQHLDTRINYLDWDGTPKWATIKSGRLQGDTKNGKIRYQTWQGGAWEATLNGKAFTHCMNGDPKRCHPDTIIKYISGAQEEWTAAALDRNTFQHTPANYVQIGKVGDWQEQVDWCITNYTTDPGEFGCGIAVQADCTTTGGRACLLKKAIGFAKIGKCTLAYGLTLGCQCHNGKARDMIVSAGEGNVCSYLKNK
jgi:hypothetical protein